MSPVRLLIAAVAAVGLSARADAGFILQTASYGGNTYHLVATDSSQTRIHWADAEAYAVTLGGHLVTVNDAAENNFLLTTFSASAVSAKATAHPFGGLLSLWLGYNDVASEGSYTWVGGSSGYTNWKPGEPFGGAADEDYAAMLVTNDFGLPGEWHDVVSDFRFNDVTYGLVEVTAPSSTATPVPATAVLLAVGAGGMVGVRRLRRRVA